MKYLIPATLGTVVLAAASLGGLAMSSSKSPDSIANRAIGNTKAPYDVANDAYDSAFGMELGDQRRRLLKDAGLAIETSLGSLTAASAKILKLQREKGFSPLERCKDSDENDTGLKAVYKDAKVTLYTFQGEVLELQANISTLAGEDMVVDWQNAQTAYDIALTCAIDDKTIADLQERRAGLEANINGIDIVAERNKNKL